MYNFFTREFLVIGVDRRIEAMNIIETLSDLFITIGMTEYIRSDNGPEFIAEILRTWLQESDVKPIFIKPESPWENGYIESFNGRLRDELLNGEIFDTLIEARVAIERLRNHYDKIRQHSSLGYRPPVLESFITPERMDFHYQVANA